MRIVCIDCECELDDSNVARFDEELCQNCYNECERQRKAESEFLRRIGGML